MGEECPEGYSNVDELDLVDISDCHINKSDVKIVYAINIVFAGILFVGSAVKVLPLLRTGQYYYDYIPHLCITSWGLHGANATVFYGYKLVAYAPYSSLDTISLLLQSISVLFTFTGTWTFIFYLMAISVFSEIGSKGAGMVKQFWGRAKVVCGIDIFWYFICPILALVRNDLIRLASYLNLVGCIFAIISGGSILGYYAWKADSLLTHIIETLPLEDANIPMFSPDRKMEKIQALKKKRKTIRILSITICAAILPSAMALVLGCMLVPSVARESWLTFSALYMMASLGGLMIVQLINPTPPSVSSLGAASRPLFLPSSVSSSRRQHTAVSVAARSQHQVSPLRRPTPAETTATFAPIACSIAARDEREEEEEEGN